MQAFHGTRSFSGSPGEKPPSSKKGRSTDGRGDLRARWSDLRGGWSDLPARGGDGGLCRSNLPFDYPMPPNTVSHATVPNYDMPRCLSLFLVKSRRLRRRRRLRGTDWRWRGRRGRRRDRRNERHAANQQRQGDHPNRYVL
jgi:hypothetical protein